MNITGAWENYNFKVTASAWNGKISKTKSLSASINIKNAVLLNIDETNYQGEVELGITSTVGGNTSPMWVDSVYIGMAGLHQDWIEEGWNLANTKKVNCSNYTISAGSSRVIYVPGSTYDSQESFTITAGTSTVAYLDRWQESAGSEYELINVYDDHNDLLDGPFRLRCHDIYQSGQNSIKIAQARNVGTYTTQGTKTVYVPNGYHGQGDITFTINIGGSSGGGSCCFPAGAPVLLANGTTAPIESLTLGTVVTGYDLDRQEFCDTEVMTTIQKKHRSDIYEVKREDGVSFLITANHVVLTKNGWKAIDVERGQLAVPEEIVTELTNTDELLKSDGNYIKIENIRYRDDLQDQNVYNIDVEEVDTYIVYDIVVHNDCSGGD